MPKPHGPWTILESQSVYRDSWIELRRDEVVRPDGQPGTHVVVFLRRGVSVLLLDDEGSVYLTDEFHYGVGRNTLEVVSGGREGDEDPLLCAQREAEEELGISARQWISLGSVDALTTILNSPAQLYLARGLTFGDSRPEGTEQIRCVKVPLTEAVEMVMDGRITHGASCVLILKTKLYLERELASPGSQAPGRPPH
ncbi:MAG: NUDIX domain-containing protein [Planctomycetales bacterium]